MQLSSLSCQAQIESSKYGFLITDERIAARRTAAASWNHRTPMAKASGARHKKNKGQGGDRGGPVRPFSGDQDRRRQPNTSPAASWEAARRNRPPPPRPPRAAVRAPPRSAPRAPPLDGSPRPPPRPAPPPLGTHLDPLGLPGDLQSGTWPPGTWHAKMTGVE